MQFEEEIKDRFGYKQMTQLNYFKKDEDNHYYVFATDKGDIFVSLYKHFLAWPKFEHEINSLEQIRKTNTIYAPKSFGIVGDIDGNGAGLVTEFVKVNDSVDWKLAGKELAEMHRYNYVATKKEQKRKQWIGGKVVSNDGIIDEEPLDFFTEFGFIDERIGIFYGKNEFVNVWTEDWVQFFSRHRLEPQFRRLIQFYGDRELIELWSNLQTQLDKYFKAIPTITPSLLHGDLSSDKIGCFKQTVNVIVKNEETGEEDEIEKEENKCIILEPISFYGHSEFDLAKVKLDNNNDFPAEFYEEYHKILKKQEGFEKRSKLYQIFFAMNNDYTENEKLIKRLMRELLN